VGLRGGHRQLGIQRGRHLPGGPAWTQATGKTVQFNPNAFDKEGKRGLHSTVVGLYNAVYRDGMAYMLNSGAIMSFNPKSGEVKEVFSLPWNGRCAKPIATQ